MERCSCNWCSLSLRALPGICLAMCCWPGQGRANSDMTIWEVPSAGFIRGDTERRWECWQADCILDGTLWSLLLLTPSSVCEASEGAFHLLLDGVSNAPYYCRLYSGSCCLCFPLVLFLKREVWLYQARWDTHLVLSWLLTVPRAYKPSVQWYFLLGCAFLLSRGDVSYA